MRYATSGHWQTIDLRYKAVEELTSHLRLLLSYASLISFKLSLSSTTFKKKYSNVILLRNSAYRWHGGTSGPYFPRGLGMPPVANQEIVYR